MYGTVARFRLIPGSEAQLLEGVREFEAARVPGYVAHYIYRMDADPQVYYLAVAFESKEAYAANANSPAQHARYLKLRDLLETDPEWHDGEIAYTHP